MPEHIQYQDDELFNPDTAHEHSDVPVRPLWIAIAVFLIFAAVSHVALWFLYRGFVVSTRNAEEAPLTAVTKPANASVPQNQPLLQPFPRSDASGQPVPPQRATPVVDLVDMRANEERILGSYGWVDRQKGVVRIPIDVAKERAAKMLQGARPVVPVPADGAAAVPAPAAGAPAAAQPPATPDTGAVPAATTSGGAHR